MKKSIAIAIIGAVFVILFVALVLLTTGCKQINELEQQAQTRMEDAPIEIISSPYADWVLRHITVFTMDDKKFILYIDSNGTAMVQVR